MSGQVEVMLPPMMSREELFGGYFMWVAGYIMMAAETGVQISAVDQQESIIEYADKNSLQIDNFFIEEGISLRKPFAERQKGGEILKRLKRGDMIITGNTSWVTSSARQALTLFRELREQGVGLHCVDLGEEVILPKKRKLVIHEGSSRVVFSLLEALSTCERVKHGHAISVAKKKLKKEGRYLGGPVPFGWQVDNQGMLIQKMSEQKRIKEIVRLREDRWSYRDISRILLERHGLRISHEGVRKALERNRKLLSKAGSPKKLIKPVKMASLVRHEE